MWRKSFIASTLVGYLVANASTMQAPGDVPGLTEQDHIDYGAQFASVGELDGQFSGSGVLIGSEWVITAAHVADYSSVMTFTIGGVTYNSSEIHVHPEYQHFATDHAYDIALVRLESPVGGIDPAQIWRFGAADDVLGLTGSWVGYGKGGDGLQGDIGSYGKRGFTNVIEYTGDELGVTGDAFVSDFDRIDGCENLSSKSDPIPTALEGQVTPLDSGGGVFVEFDGVNYLAGVISFRGVVDGTHDSDYGDLSGAINLQPFLEWIEGTSGISAVPEPRWFAAFAGLFALAALRWRRR